MRSQEIPIENWVPFFNDLSKRHQGEHVTVELQGRDIGQQLAARDQSLLGISVDMPTGACKIDVMMGESAGANVSHEISHPIHVRLAMDDNGEEAVVEIESDAGPSTLLRFQSSAKPA